MGIVATYLGANTLTVEGKTYPERKQFSLPFRFPPSAPSALASSTPATGGRTPPGVSVTSRRASHGLGHKPRLRREKREGRKWQFGSIPHCLHTLIHNGVP